MWHQKQGRLLWAGRANIVAQHMIVRPFVLTWDVFYDKVLVE